MQIPLQFKHPIHSVKIPRFRFLYFVFEDIVEILHIVVFECVSVMKVLKRFERFYRQYLQLEMLSFCLNVWALRISALILFITHFGTFSWKSFTSH